MVMAASLEVATTTLHNLESTYMSRISIDVSRVSKNIDSISQKLSACAMTFLPFTLVTGLFGMNVKVITHKHKHTHTHGRLHKAALDCGDVHGSQTSNGQSKSFFVVVLRHQVPFQYSGPHSSGDDLWAFFGIIGTLFLSLVPLILFIRHYIHSKR